MSKSQFLQMLHNAKRQFVISQYKLDSKEIETLDRLLSEGLSFDAIINRLKDLYKQGVRVC